MLPKDVALPSVPFVFFFKTVAASFRRKLEQWHAFNDCSICSSRVPDVFGGQCQGAYDHPGTPGSPSGCKQYGFEFDSPTLKI